MIAVSDIRNHVTGKLEKGLSPALTYHNAAHTLDVFDQVIKIAAGEGINEEELLLLQTGALYHDTGFLVKYKDHEDESCLIAKHELTGFGFNGRMIERVCGMIMATRVPQTPKNKLEEILCDADLDYLGRPDFWNIGERLYQEFLDQKLVSNYHEWNLLQVRFLENHRYFTTYSKHCRQQQKQLHAEAIKLKITDPQSNYTYQTGTAPNDRT